MMELFRRIARLPPGASTFADGVDGLHAAIILSTFAVGLVLFAMCVLFVVRYRRRGKLETPRIVASTKGELGIVAFVTISFVAFWVVGFRQYAEMTAPPLDAQTVYVDAKQWMWKFAYTDGRAANDVLTVHVNQPVKLVMTSRDVIHSFYVPAFRIKQDVLPGRYTTTWFVAKDPGTYPIYCAEFCGVSHSAMLGSVRVLGDADYEAWKNESAAVDNVERGREVATRRGCLACHSLDGKRMVGPTFKGLFGSDRTLSDGRHVVANDDYLTRAIMEPNADVVAGFPAGMPPYQGILEPAETAALIELIRGTK